MENTILQTPSCKLKEFNNLFIELTAKNCNQHCKHCYIDFPLSRNVKDFIPLEVVKEALIDIKNENIKCIYLTGAEPMTHPEFNHILRACLKQSNVCICTNSSFLNEKKVRFLKRVEDESNYELIFKLSLDHYNELKNDEIRSRGSYRQVVHAIKHLAKYNFNPIISVTNYYKEDKQILIEEFKKICYKVGFEAKDSNFIINEYYNKHSQIQELTDFNYHSLDCEYGRTLTAKGIYSCPMLANDHRGRCGSNFKDFSKHNTLETNCCFHCIKNNYPIFGINYDLFQ